MIEHWNEKSTKRALWDIMVERAAWSDHSLWALWANISNVGDWIHFAQVLAQSVGDITTPLPPRELSTDALRGALSSENRARAAVTLLYKGMNPVKLLSFLDKDIFVCVAHNSCWANRYWMTIILHASRAATSLHRAHESNRKLIKCIPRQSVSQLEGGTIVYASFCAFKPMIWEKGGKIVRFPYHEQCVQDAELVWDKCCKTLGLPTLHPIVDGASLIFDKIDVTDCKTTDQTVDYIFLVVLCICLNVDEICTSHFIFGNGSVFRVSVTGFGGGTGFFFGSYTDVMRLRKTISYYSAIVSPVVKSWKIRNSDIIGAALDDGSFADKYTIICR